MLPDVNPQPPVSITRTKIALVTAAVVLLCAGAWYLLSGAGLGSWDFRNNLWGPAHLLVTGRSPYDIELLFPGSNAVWMPTVIGTFFPIGFLTEQSATALWTVINGAAYLLLGVLVMQEERPKPLLAGVCLLLMMIFPPFISLIRLGQYSVLTGLLLLSAAWLLQSRVSPFWIGLMIALAAAKPQLLVLPVTGLLWQMWSQGERGRALLTVLASGVWVLVLTLPLWVAYPSWFEGFLAALARNVAWLHPSIYVVLPQHFGQAGTLAWMVLAVLAFAINLRLWRSLPTQSAMIWSLALNLLVTTYVWSWDFVLLVPLLIAKLVTLRSTALRILLLVGYVMIWVGMVAQRLTTSNDDVLYWWLPWAVVGLVVLIDSLNQRLPQTANQPQISALR